MGTPAPAPIDEDGFHKRIVTAQVLIVVSGGLLLVLLGAVLVLSFRKWQRPKFSLARLLAMTVLAGAAVLSGMYWRQALKAFDAARAEIAAAQARYKAAYDNEKPAHPVTLTQPFYMGKLDVTQEQYAAVMEQNPANFKNKNKDNPVETVSWDDAQAFCKKLTEQTKERVRLPTEAEWEFACRAGTTSTYYSGDSDKDLDRVAWYYANSKSSTHPVGKKDPNAFGLYDMHGNVWQWCQDWWEDNYLHAAPADPQGPAQGGTRVLRGGSWGNLPVDCRSAYRFSYDPDFRYQYFGFRVVVVLSSRIP
jgi:formylglycine-generating enzyme required for sulfatase activity